VDGQPDPGWLEVGVRGAGRQQPDLGRSAGQPRRPDQRRYRGRLQRRQRDYHRRLRRAHAYASGRIRSQPRRQPDAERARTAGTGRQPHRPHHQPRRQPEHGLRLHHRRQSRSDPAEPAGHHRHRQRRAGRVDPAKRRFDQSHRADRNRGLGRGLPQPEDRGELPDRGRGRCRPDLDGNADPSGHRGAELLLPRPAGRPHHRNLRRPERAPLHRAKAGRADRR